MHTLLEKIGAVIFSAGLAISSFFGFTPQVQEQPIEEPIEELGRAINPVGGKTYTLYGGGISSADTTITLSSFKIPVSEIPYSMANFGDGVNAKGYVTLEPGSATKQEFVSFTGVTQNSDGTATLTGVSRGLAPVAPYTASTTYAKAHSGGSVVVISNPPQLYEAIYSYIDNATTSGAVDGTVTAKGIYETATGFEAASTTQIGGGNTTAALVLTTLISTSTGGTARTIPVTNSTGKIDGAFCCSGTTTFTGITAFTATTTGTLGSSTIRVYTASTTWSKPAFLKHIVVEVVGGGGGGGGGSDIANDSDGNGGGAGGYAKELITADELTGTSTVMVSVGAGGIAGASGGGTGGLGATTFFGNFLQATGGAGGTTGATSGGGTGGIGSLGDINIQGGGGSLRADVVAGNDSGGGAGGSSVLGGGGAGRATSGDGIAGGAYGGGGGGGSAQGPNVAGGAGAQGVVIITEYF